MIETPTRELLRIEQIKKLQRQNRIAEGELIARADVLKRLRKMERGLQRDLKAFYVDAGSDVVARHIAVLIADLTQRE